MVREHNVLAEGGDDELVGGDRGTYTGDMHRNVRHGTGVYKFPNRFFCYEGEYVNGKKHGHGTFTMGDGSVYVGNFVNNEIEGHGKRTWPDGSNYVGEFSFGEMHGEGEYTNGPDGWSYIGHWSQNQRQGPGILYHANGDRYEGLFQAHQEHDPNGALFCANGDTYEGGWECGQRSGYGRYNSVNGDRYEGHWKNGMRSGEGVQQFSNGIEWRGEWVDDSLMARPRYLQLFTTPPAPATSQSDAEPEPAPDLTTEPESGAEPKPEDIQEWAPPLFPAALTVMVGGELPDLYAQAVVNPAAEPPAESKSEGDELEDTNPAGEPAQEHIEEQQLLPALLSTGESGRLISVSLIPCPQKAEPDCIDSEEAAGNEASDKMADADEAGHAESSESAPTAAPEEQPVAPVAAFAGKADDSDALCVVSVRTVSGIAYFPAGTLRISPDTLPGEYELRVEDSTEHADAAYKLTACRLATESAMEMIKVTIEAQPELEPEVEDQ